MMKMGLPSRDGKLKAPCQEEEEEEEEEGLLKADAVNEEDPERDRAREEEKEEGLFKADAVRRRKVWLGRGGHTIVPSCTCLLYTSPSPRDKRQSRMPSSA